MGAVEPADLFPALVVALIVAVHCAYAMARFRFAGKNLVLVALLATSMIPGIAILVPLYDLSVHAKLYDTFVGLVIVYAAWNVPILVWLLRGFFESVPVELEEAARIDGCSRLRAFYKIVLPMSQPGLLAAAIMVIMFVWNDFLIAAFLTRAETKTLSVALLTAYGTKDITWGTLGALAHFSTIPIVLIALALNRYFVQGLTRGIN